MTNPTPQRVYAVAVGTVGTGPFITIIRPYAPSPMDLEDFKIGQRWVDSTTNGEYILLNFTTIGGYLQANWVLLNAGSGSLSQLKDNLGNVVVPDGFGAINVIGDAASGITTDGTLAANTLTAVLAAVPNSSLANSSVSVASPNNSITVSGSPVSLGGTVNVEVAGGGVAWVQVATAVPQTMAINTGYIPNNGGGLVTLNLPAVANFGDTFIVQGMSSGGWLVNATGAQVINVGSTPTSGGGSIASTNQWDSITITCVAANTTFAARAVQGNLTIT